MPSVIPSFTSRPASPLPLFVALAPDGCSVVRPVMPYGFSSKFRRACGVSMPTSVAADDSLLMARRPRAPGMRVRYWFSFFHFTTRFRLMPH